MLRMSATETKFLARAGGARCPAYGFFGYFALSFYMSLKGLWICQSTTSRSINIYLTLY